MFVAYVYGQLAYLFLQDTNGLANDSHFHVCFGQYARASLLSVEIAMSVVEGLWPIVFIWPFGF